MIEIRKFKNPNGPTIGTATGKVIQKDGLYFRDLAGTGELLPYEDWRLPAKERAKDLAARLSIEEIAGLMMYSPHQQVPSTGMGSRSGTYDGKRYEESGAPVYALTDQQKEYLTVHQIRYILIVGYESTEAAVGWNNELQALAEKTGHGIPVNLSTDPRNRVKEDVDVEYKSGSGAVSQWPEGLGMAALHDPKRVREYAGMISREYRALGIATALSPQADLGTEPRWMRIEDTFGADPALVRDCVRAYCDGMQTGRDTAKDGPGVDGPWGWESVATMVKHWPGGGPLEGGRDAHYPFGAYAVYPGDSFDAHLMPFLEGAFALKEGTEKSASVMPYYSVSTGRDTVYGKNVGNSYSHYLIHDLLREKYGFDGVVCTDWGITGDPDPNMDSFGARCYGVEDMTEAERELLLIENGVDQFGGNFDVKPVLEAYRLGCERHGEKAMRARMERSAVRLLTNSFRCGLFDDPYLDAEESCAVVGCREFVEAGFKAQADSVVMVKNGAGAPVLPMREKAKVYVPIRHVDPGKGFIRMIPTQPYDVDPAENSGIEAYFERVNTPEEADFAMVFIESPHSECYIPEDVEQGGNGYFPICLQYRPYVADTAREVSLAGGDFRENFTNRSYKGKAALIYNASDLDLVEETKKAMGDKPVITVLRMHLPTVPSELEPVSDALLVEFGVSKRAIYELVSGRREPAGRLPVQMPASMEAVERHCEDKPLDMECYVDSQGHTYDFGYGLNFKGVI